MNILILWPNPREKDFERTIDDSEAYDRTDGLKVLRELGHKVTVKDPHLFPLNPFAQKGSLLGGIDPLRFLWLCFNSHRFDVIISAAASSILLFMLAKRLFRLKKHIIIIDPALTTGYPNRKKIQDMVLPFADHVIVFGNNQSRYLEKEYGGKIKHSFIKHRIDTTFFNPYQPSLGKSTTKEPYIISIGNDITRDYETLVDAVKGTNIKTIIITNRPIDIKDATNIEIVSKHISWEALREYYHNAKLAVLSLHPSIHAGGINSLLEAMAMKKAVIVSKSDGIIDYVKDGITAAVVPPEDHLALRNMIKNLYNNEQKCREIGKRAHEYCLKECAIEVYGNKINEIIKNIKH